MAVGLKENYGDAPTRSSNQCDDLCFHLNIIQALDRQMDGRTVMVIQYCALCVMNYYMQQKLSTML